jgi:putative phage-type endonuclease
MIILRSDIQQNTEAWLKWRRLGGSDAAVIMAISPWCDITTLYERKLGLAPDIEANEAMQRGHDLEPEARILLEMEQGFALPAACYENTDYPWATASVDGISSSGSIISEIKCPGLTTHRECLNGKIKPYYMAQCQHNMGVTEAQVCYYFSYTDLPDIQSTKLIEIPRDEDYIQRMFEREQIFWECLQNRTPPDESWFGVKDAGAYNGYYRSDPMWRLALAEFITAKKVLADAKAQYAIRAKRIEELMQKKKQIMVIENGFNIERVYTNGNWRIQTSTTEKMFVQ